MRWKTMATVMSVLLALGSTGHAAAAERVEETVLEAGFDVEPGRTLTVELRDADVELRTGDGDRVEIRVLLSARPGSIDRARARVETMNFRAEQQGGDVILTSERPRGAWSWIGQGYSLRAVVQLPERFDVELSTGDGDVMVESLRGRADLRTGDGDVSLESFRDGALAVRTSDGDIRLGEILATTVELGSSDGDIHAGRIDAESARVRTSDGDVVLRAVLGGIDASTGDGDIRVGLETAAETTLASNDGDIVIDVPPDAGYEIDLRGEEVEIRGRQVLDGRRTSRFATGRLGAGGPSLNARTRDGSVVLRIGG